MLAASLYAITPTLQSSVVWCAVSAGRSAARTSWSIVCRLMFVFLACLDSIGEIHSKLAGTTYHAGRDPGHNCEVRNVFRHHCARANHCLPAYRQAAKNGRIGANACSFPDKRGLELPIRSLFQGPVLINRGWIPIIGETCMWANEDPIFDRHAFWYESKCLNLYIAANHNFGTDLNEGPDLGPRPNLATVQVYEIADASNTNIDELGSLIGGDTSAVSGVRQLA